MRSTFRFDDQVAIVTGGTSGIGLAVAKVLAAYGARVVVVGTNADHLREAIEGLDNLHPHFVLGLRLDVRSESDMNAMVGETIDRFGGVDILVASAGVGKARNSSGVPHPLSHCSVEEFDEIVDCNLTGVFLSNRAVLPSMIARGGGDIINISSSPGGIAGQPLSSAYCASKFGVNGLSKALAAEVRGFGIRVQVVFPDATDTPLIRHSTLATRLDAPLSPDRIAYHVSYLLASPNSTMWPEDGPMARSVMRRAFVDAKRQEAGWP